MDEWVSLSRIDVARGAVEEGPKELDFQLEAEFGRERKVTRNLKRKHDEINHVQKVGRGAGGTRGSRIHVACRSVCGWDQMESSDQRSFIRSQSRDQDKF